MRLPLTTPAAASVVAALLLAAPGPHAGASLAYEPAPMLIAAAPQSSAGNTALGTAAQLPAAPREGEQVKQGNVVMASPQVVARKEACRSSRSVTLVVRTPQEIKELEAERAKMPDLEVPAGSDLERMLSGGTGSVDPRSHSSRG